MSITLSEMTTGMTGTVQELSSAGPLRHRLLDLGVVPGTRIERVMSSAGGDPTCYRVRGAMIALRRSDAAQVRVTV